MHSLPIGAWLNKSQTSDMKGGFSLCKYMWHSQIEIEYYSVVYFKRITEFDAL